MKQILFASANTNKINDLKVLAKEYKIDLISAQELLIEKPDLEAIPEVEETELTYYGNALLKAKAFKSWSGMSVISDDSGIEVECLGGEPGIYSARYGGPNLSPTDRIQYMLDKIGDASNRNARMISLLILIDENDNEIVGNGSLEGKIINFPKGEKGWGYEPIFVPINDSRTIAEIRDAGEKPQNHRISAWNNLMTKIK